TIPEPETLFDDYEGRSPAAKQHAMGIADHMGPHRLMLKYSSTFTPEQFKVFDGFYRPRNEAFLKADLTGKERTRWHYQRYIKNYLRCVAGLDENIGRLMDFLEQEGLSENTVVIYSSDQGFYLGEHGWFDKRWMYEESLRSPLLVRWPGVVEAGSKNADMVSNLDFAQTLLEIAGAPQPEAMQGRSLVPLFKGTTPADWRTSFYYHYYESGGHGVPAHYGVATERYKLIHYYEPKLDAWELFDLKRDPREMTSRHDHPEFAEVRRQLEDELKRLRKALKL
ncbi:MAG: sulfatase/phosphatase domain-containing protein, partial [Verrucomicrobiota bacterium]